MNKKYKILVSIVILLVFLQGGLLFLILQKDKPIDLKQNHRSLYISSSFYDEAYDLIDDGFEFESEKVVAAISPHHLFVKDRIASLFELLAKYDYDQVIMIGPDHLNDAGYEIVTSRTNWTTPYGELKADSEFTDKLLQTDFVDLSERGMAEEFAISGLVPFVKKSWPKVEFVPIIVSSNVGKDKLDQLIDFIQKNKSQNSLFIASVDFSHYASPDEAEKEDEISNLVIKNLELVKALTAPVDSPASIYVILNYVVNNSVKNNQLLSHTNTGTMQPWSSETAVTHNVWIFW